jgi:hypothetical protein
MTMYKYILIALCVLSCSKEAPIEVKQLEPIKVETKNSSLSIPKGEDCEKYFPLDAVKKSKKNGGFFINEKRSIYLNDYGVLLTNVMIKQMKLYLTVNILNKRRTICIKQNSVLGVGFGQYHTHITNGSFESNCNDLSDPTGAGAVGAFEIPLNSTLFKDLLRNPPLVLGVELKQFGNSLFKAIKEETAIELQNTFRCVYEAFGGADQINLENDDLLIDTLVPAEDPDENSAE